jgi:hypothetical protein
MPVPVQTTLVPVVGAVELHAALAVPDSAAYTKTALQMPISSTFFMDRRSQDPRCPLKIDFFLCLTKCFIYYLTSGLLAPSISGLRA